MSSVKGKEADRLIVQSISVISTVHDDPDTVGRLVCPVCSQPVELTIEAIAACSRCHEMQSHLIGYLRDLLDWELILDEYLTGATDDELAGIDDELRAQSMLFLAECRKLATGLDLFTISEPMVHLARQEPASYRRLNPCTTIDGGDQR